ncbi:MAG TPA: hypothetical protein VLF41_01995 [Candidatus Nanoarchaeia archaeon]|nr:hypothetical protein [Candidatus Nanoarchaeia archaeon]
MGEVHRLHSRLHLHWHKIETAFITLIWLVVAASPVKAASITNAQALLSDARPQQPNVIYTFNFRLNSATVVKSFQAQACTTSGGGCVKPTGFSATTVALTSQPSGFGASSGWVNDSIAGSLRVKNTTNTTTPAADQSIGFVGITNPDNAGSFFLRLTAYNDDNYSNPSDETVVTFDITPAVTLSLTVDPTISFDVSGVPSGTVYKGSLATSDRCQDGPNNINFGTNTLALVADTNYDCAQQLTTSTNGQSGYEVTVNGVVPGNDFINTSNPTVTIADWSGTNDAPSPTPTSGQAELFGYTTNANSLSGSPDRFSLSDNLFAALSDSPAQVAHSVGSVANDQVNVAYRLRFYVLSPSGSFQAKVVYTCLPTF